MFNAKKGLQKAVNIPVNFAQVFIHERTVSGMEYIVTAAMIVIVAL
jgi:hypothetical protein